MAISGSVPSRRDAAVVAAISNPLACRMLLSALQAARPCARYLPPPRRFLRYHHLRGARLTARTTLRARRWRRPAFLQLREGRARPPQAERRLAAAADRRFGSGASISGSVAGADQDRVGGARLNGLKDIFPSPQESPPGDRILPKRTWISHRRRPFRSPLPDVAAGLFCSAAAMPCVCPFAWLPRRCWVLIGLARGTAESAF